MENYRVIHKHSLLGNEMIPVNDELDYGEIAIDYHGGSEALYIKNDNDEIVSFTPKPVVVYETDGTTGLLGLNESSFGNNNWQLEDLNLSGFSFIRCYFKASASGASQPTGAMVVDIPLDNAASVGSSYAYFGSVLQLHPFNRNRQIGMGCAVDSTKTKFKVVYQITLWDISVSDANSASDARYLYKIVGYYEY